jgi:hypothetical protein
MAHTVNSNNNKAEAVLEVVMGASNNKVEVVMGATVVMVTRWTSS